MNEEERQDLLNYIGSYADCENQFDKTLKSMGLTPYLISKVIKVYNKNIVDFNKAKDMINKILSGPIHYANCLSIKSFEIYPDRLIINAITYSNNHCLATIYF
jgi:hypothetical protein